MSEYLGRPLDNCEIVHHCNENKQDNRIENLELTLDGKHKSLHAKKGRTMVTLICSHCGKEFQREKRRVNKNYKNYFCDRKCYKNPKKAAVAQLVRAIAL